MKRKFSYLCRLYNISVLWAQVMAPFGEDIMERQFLCFFVWSLISINTCCVWFTLEINTSWEIKTSCYVHFTIIIIVSQTVSDTSPETFRTSRTVPRTYYIPPTGYRPLSRTIPAISRPFPCSSSVAGTMPWEYPAHACLPSPSNFNITPFCTCAVWVDPSRQFLAIRNHGFRDCVMANGGRRLLD